MVGWHPTQPVLEEGTGPWGVVRDDNPQTERVPKVYDSQARYLRYRSRPKPERNPTPAKESKDFQVFGRSRKLEQDMSPSYGHLTSLPYSRPHTPQTDFSDRLVAARDEYRQGQSAVAFPWHTSYTEDHDSSLPITFQQEDRGLNQFSPSAVFSTHQPRNFQGETTDDKRMRVESSNSKQPHSLQAEIEVKKYSQSTGFDPNRDECFEESIPFDGSPPEAFSINHPCRFQVGRDFNRYPLSAAGGNNQCGKFEEADGLFDNYSQPICFKHNQPDIIQTGGCFNQNFQLADFGTNRYRNFIEAENKFDHDSIPSSSHASESAYKAAYLRCGQPQHDESSRAANSQYFSILEKARCLDASRNGIEASTSLHSAELRHPQECSRLARGFYSPASYNEHPRPPQPQYAYQEQEEAGRKRQAVREAQEEFEREEKKLEKLHAKRDELLREHRAQGLRNAKTALLDRSIGIVKKEQTRAFNPDCCLPRKPPAVPRPRLTPKQTSSDYDPFMNGSGLKYLADISEQSLETSWAIREFLAQGEIERFIKSFSASKAQFFLDSLTELNIRIDWLGDYLRKGDKDGRKLFLDQHHMKITTIYNPVSCLYSINYCVLTETSDDQKVDRTDIRLAEDRKGERNTAVR